MPRPPFCSFIRHRLTRRLAERIRHILELLGVTVIAVVTALGGGTMRDLLLDRHSVFWIARPELLLVCLVSTGCTLLYVYLRIPGFRALCVADALGLAFWVITGVAGGVLRDVLLAEIPLILRRGQLYASAAILGAALYLLLERAWPSAFDAREQGWTKVILHPGVTAERKPRGRHPEVASVSKPARRSPRATAGKS